jgi:hypothetical protein
VTEKKFDDPPILPTIGQVIGAGKERFKELRPHTANAVDYGRYAAVFEGWRAQFALLRARLGDEVRAARLPFAEGQALTDLARSEYETPRREEATRALGEVILVRQVVHFRADDAPFAARDAHQRGWAHRGPGRCAGGSRSRRRGSQ